MIRILTLIALLIVLQSGPVSAIAIKSEALQSGATANGDGTISAVQGYTTAVVQVEGLGSATINFEASVSGTGYNAVQCWRLADRTKADTTTTTNGIWRCNITGLNKFRARISGYASGTITVTAMYMAAGVF